MTTEKMICVASNLMYFAIFRAAAMFPALPASVAYMWFCICVDDGYIPCEQFPSRPRDECDTILAFSISTHETTGSFAAGEIIIVIFGSWCFTVFHGGSRCFTALFHAVSRCSTPLFHGVSLLCFMVFHAVSRCLIALFRGVSRCFTALFNAVSRCFIDLFHAVSRCFIALFHPV